MVLVFLAGGSVVAAMLAFLLSTAEAAFTRLSRKEAEEIAQKHGSQAVEEILASPAPHTLALQMWRWVFTTAALVLLTVTAIRLTGDLVWGAVVSTVTAALLGVIGAAVSPGRVGRTRHVMIASATARLVRGLRVVLGPLPDAVAALAARVVPSWSGVGQSFFDDEELREYVVRAQDADIIEDSEAELIQSVFDLSATRVRSVMVPRTDMVTVDAEDSLSQTMDLFLRSGFSRIPVTLGSPDEITGIIYLKDVAYLEHALSTGSASESFAGRQMDQIEVTEVQRDVRFVPESKTVSELLSELQRESTHVAIVVDEYGGTAGLVTLEDLIEEIVGEIIDEYDTEAAEIEELDEDRRRLSARMSVDDFAEIYDLDLEDEEEVDTLGGLFAKALGRVPIAGSEVEIPGRTDETAVVLRADRIEGRRNRVSHILVWQVEDRRGARAGLGTEDEDPAFTATDDTAAPTRSRS